MLSFDQKLSIIQSFAELTQHNVSLGRVNFHFEDSAHEKKTVVYHLHPNGNGFVFAGLVNGIQTDDKGMVNIRDYNEDELRALIMKSITSLATTPRLQVAAPAKSKASNRKAPKEETWVGPDNATLTLQFEDDLWYVYAGLSLESAFETYEEAEQYLEEEQFTRA
ncbi:hypothetical protein [Paenibacillus harenae]|uniref:Uncharacterized protein n=1 Tax=Paenibacillus harenae TaxID=306543 RepID=A0ABT9U1E9_PAEHA|nr:hypothetical protein [Paenibacillus harenae]MDQ0113443.1 hypothetical protein [Paenibacillus harenae]